MSTPVDPATGSTITAAIVDGAVLRDELLERVGEVRAVLRLSARERVVRGVVRVRQMIDDGSSLRRELFSIRFDAADGDAAEADAVIATRAPDESDALRLALRLPVGERDLERRVDRLGAGVAEEDVVDVRREAFARAVAPARRRADVPSGTAARSP